jgi:PilZ domain-containing protein
MAQPKQPANRRNTAMESGVHSFIRRDPRYNIETPIVFHLPEGSVKGQSINISESGMFAAFDREIEPWLTGRLSAQFWDWHIDFSVRVARIQEHKAGWSSGASAKKTTRSFGRFWSIRMARSRERGLSSDIDRSDIHRLRHLRLNHGTHSTSCLEVCGAICLTLTHFRVS